MEKNRIAFCGGTPFADNETGAMQNLPCEFLLLRYGKNDYSKENRSGSFEFSEADADLVIRDFAARGRDLVIDYEHQSLTGGKAPAAGWIDRLAKCADGLLAHVKYWTDEAVRLLGSGEYRYFSPTLYFSRSGKNVSAVHSVALTNHPALHNIPALAADDLAADEGEAGAERTDVSGDVLSGLLQMMDLPECGGSAENAAEAVRAGIARLTDLERSVMAFLSENGCAGLAEAAEQKKRLEDEVAALKSANLVAQAFRDGKLTEAERPWAEHFASADPDAFSAWCVGAPRRIPDNRDLEERRRDREGNGPTESERRIFRMLGVDPRTSKHNNKEN